jgi:hemerythrin-like domain-containing protein
MSESLEAPKPSAVLRAEHEVIKRVLGVLERLVARSLSGEGFEAEFLTRCVEFFRAFADACHHAKEEDLLFPLLESRGIPREGGPIGVMLEEHKLARAYTRDMGEALEAKERGEAEAVQQFHAAARLYLDLLTNHISKENDVLFTMGDRVLTPQDQDSLSGKFCEVACRSFRGKKIEELERSADELEEQWPTG